MATMPPEMSTNSAANNPSSVSLNASRSSSDSLARSRFMITDILAAQQSHSPSAALSPHPPQALAHAHHSPHHVALQQYLAQQQHLLQQRHQHAFNGGTLSPAASPKALSAHHLPPPPPHSPSLLNAAAAGITAAQSPNAQTPFSSHLAHPLGHLPPSALMGFHGAHNGFGAAAAAAHYAALQRDERDSRERDRLRDMDESSYRASSTQSFDADDRSRSPQPMFYRNGRELNGMPNAVGSGGPGNAGVGGGNANSSAVGSSGGVGGAGGGNAGDGSISGDQASTIDDSDSDCGAKDDDGHSSKSGDNLMGLTKKQRKARTAFTDHQLQTLEKSFERQKYLSVQDRMELANKLELSDCQVKTWYQNRRTKWKRQTAVGLELLAEAGNYAAFQRLYGGSPYLTSWPYAHPPPSHHMSPASPIDMYYRQAAAAAVLQKPLSYRMYPSMNPMATSGLSGMPLAPAPISHLSASNSLQSLSSYYQSATQSFGGSNNSPPHSSALPAKSPSRSEDIDGEDHHRKSVELIDGRSCSPTLNPGSPSDREGDAEGNTRKLLAARAKRKSNAEAEEDEEDAIEV